MNLFISDTESKTKKNNDLSIHLSCLSIFIATSSTPPLSALHLLVFILESVSFISSRSDLDRHSLLLYYSSTGVVD